MSNLFTWPSSHHLYFWVYCQSKLMACTILYSNLHLVRRMDFPSTQISFIYVNLQRIFAAFPSYNAPFTEGFSGQRSLWQHCHRHGAALGSALSEVLPGALRGAANVWRRCNECNGCNECNAERGAEGCPGGELWITID